MPLTDTEKWVQDGPINELSKFAAVEIIGSAYLVASHFVPHKLDTDIWRLLCALHKRTGFQWELHVREDGTDSSGAISYLVSVQCPRLESVGLSAHTPISHVCVVKDSVHMKELIVRACIGCWLVLCGKDLRYVEQVLTGPHPATPDPPAQPSSDDTTTPPPAEDVPSCGS